jgi:hypothetical protein
MQYKAAHRNKAADRQTVADLSRAAERTLAAHRNIEADLSSATDPCKAVLQTLAKQRKEQSMDYLGRTHESETSLDSLNNEERSPSTRGRATAMNATTNRYSTDSKKSADRARSSIYYLIIYSRNR